MHDGDDDVRLMLALGAGDESAFDQLFARWAGPLLRHLERIVRDAATAEELVQETFLRLYRARERYEPNARFSTWLYTIARRLALNALDRAAAQREQPLDPADLPDAACPAPGPPEQLARRRRQARLQAALRTLPADDRSVLALAYVQALSLADIARIEDCSAAAVRTRLWRARQRLRDALGPDLEDDHDA